MPTRLAREGCNADRGPEEAPPWLGSELRPRLVPPRSSLHFRSKPCGQSVPRTVLWPRCAISLLPDLTLQLAVAATDVCSSAWCFAAGLKSANVQTFHQLAFAAVVTNQVVVVGGEDLGTDFAERLRSEGIRWQSCTSAAQVPHRRWRSQLFSLLGRLRASLLRFQGTWFASSVALRRFVRKRPATWCGVKAEKNCRR